MSSYPKTTGQYTGHFLDELRHGDGILEWSNGDMYEGKFWRGMRHGYGEIVLNKACGNDSLTSSQQVYKGEWYKSTRHGEGVQIWSSSSSPDDPDQYYEGNWKEDEFHGIGYFKTIGGTYAGEFKMGKKHGFGLMLYNCGSLYEGEWVDGRLHGWGEYIFPDQSKYNGGWICGLRNGMGLFLDNDSGEEYLGEWRDGLKHGNGVHKWSNGETRRGIWENGTLKQWTKRLDKFGKDMTKCDVPERPSNFSSRMENIPKRDELKALAFNRAAFREFPKFSTKS